MPQKSDHMVRAEARLYGHAKRRFIDAPAEQRCEWTVTLRDGSKAQCGRRKVDGLLCTQHAKMDERLRASMTCCGGSDEHPPEHCQDCSAIGGVSAPTLKASDGGAG